MNSIVQKIEKYPFDFSIIMAVYNVGPYLEEAVNSLLEQTFSFQKVQVILINDGSTDNSGTICDKYKKDYPSNIIVLHQANQGQAAARNEGLKLATGRYINFMDPDDKLQPGVLEGVFDFFVENEKETDVVAIPMKYFEALSSAHALNYKFQRGNGVVSLLQNYDAVQLSASSAFFAHEAAKTMHFDSSLVTAEDAKEVLKVLSRKLTLGLYRSQMYLYRRRSAKDSSLQTASEKHDWYCEQLQAFNLSMLDYYKDLMGYVPLFVQYTLTFDLHWRLKQPKISPGILTEEEEQRYVQLIGKFFRNIDNQVIMQQKSFSAAHKFFAMTLKYGRMPQKFCGNDTIIFHYDSEVSFSLQSGLTKIDLLKITDHTLLVEGLSHYIWTPEYDPANVQMKLKIGDQTFACEKTARAEDSVAWFYKMYREEPFRCEIDLREHPEILGNDVSLFLEIDGAPISRKNLQFQSLSPFNDAFDKQYYFKNGYSILKTRTGFCIQKCSTGQHVKLELNFSRELWSKHTLAAKKAILVRWYVFLLRLLFPNRKIWLISDKASRSDDNGEAFFKFVSQKKNSGVKPYFVISQSSPDFKRMQQYGKVIPHMSYKLKIKHLLADAVLSAHTHAEIQNPFQKMKKYYQDLMSDRKMVFLQHGITYNDISSAIHKYRKNYRLITAASPKEAEGFLNHKYGYSEDEILLSGFARYDYLYNDPQKKITIMPTWRRWLFDAYDPIADQWSLSNDFERSAYYQFFNGLLSDRQLLEAADKMGYQIQFLPHPVLFPYLDHFSTDQRVHVLGRDTVYRKIFAESDLVLTDYSSAVFDFAYLEKPLIYMFFDSEEFFGTQYSGGYFTIEKDGFGEVEYTLEDTVSRIIAYMENGCTLKPVYRERIHDFYKHHDKDNCQRIYEAVLNLKD